MFIEILPDLFRGSITTICLLFLFSVLSKPKLKMKLYFIFGAIVVVIDTFICSLFYLNKEYTYVVYYSLMAYILLVIGCKFLFSGKILQWGFNCVTVLNVYVIIVMASYYLADLFPHPNYSVTFIRIFLFATTILIFRKYLRPLYLSVSENWAAFLLPTIGILINYIYLMLSLGNVEDSMSENIIYYCFLTLITILTYIAIVFSLKKLQQKYMLLQENIKRKANEELLSSEIASYESFVLTAKQTKHDIRHHNAILAEYLNSSDIEGAKEYLELYDKSILNDSYKEFDKDPIANAVFRLYDRRTRELNIDFKVRSQIEVKELNFHIDIGILLSNIFENALESCKKCNLSPKYIYYSSIIQTDSVLIEIKNSISNELFFENGLPITTKVGGGTGLLSVKDIVQKHNGMLEVKKEGNEFITRIILPIIQNNN